MPHIQLKTQIPGPKSKALAEERKTHVARGPRQITPVYIASGNGALLTDVDGNQFIDLATGIGVNNVGQANPAIVKAVQEQAARTLHLSINVTAYEGYVALARTLNEIVPGAGPKKTFLANSGAEAVENAVKIARAYTGRQAVICFDHAFHGRTYMAMSLTAKSKPYRYGFAPFNPEVYRAPFPYVYRWRAAGEPAADEETVSRECFARFEEMVTSQVSPDKVAAVIIEPVIGEGGFMVAPASFLKKLREYCTQHKIVFIADEIQSGFGRTGSMFATEQLGVTADLYTLAKGMGGGMPISAVTGSAEIMDGPIEGGIGGTYGGNPVGCAAALAVIELFQKGDLLARARATGELLAKRLTAWQARFPFIGDARGLGAMRAIELVRDRKSREPDSTLPGKIILGACERGAIVISAGTFGNVLRFLPPLGITPEQLNEGLDAVEAAMTAVSGS